MRDVAGDAGAAAKRWRATPEQGTQIALERLESTRQRYDMAKPGRLESVRVLEELFFDLVVAFLSLIHI